MNRRAFLKLSAVLGSASLSTAFFRQAHATQISGSGSAEVLSISDGFLRLPASFVLPDVPPAELAKVLGELPGQTHMIERPLNATLLKGDTRAVLFDVGSGPNFMPGAGRLGESLDALGVTAEAITDIVFTHGHPDHLWGILDDFDDLWFPQAQLHFPRTEFDFWMDAGTVDAMPEARKGFAVGAKARLEAIADRINRFDDGAEIVPGVEAMATRGHTPGHTSFVIHTAAEPIMVVGDALTHDLLSFQRPHWPAGGDQDHDMAVRTRQQLLDRLAGEHMLMIGYHLSGTGTGRAERSGSAYRFIPS